MQAKRSLDALRMMLERILEKAFPRQSGAARLQQVGLFTLIYLMQADKEDVTARRLSHLTGQSEGDVSTQVKKLVALDLIERTQITNKQGRGRAFKLTVKDNATAKRLTKAIDKAAGGRKRTQPL
jgi:DNA-binding MarR family transcriptional regulator